MRTEYSVNDMTSHRIVEQEQGFTPKLEFLPTPAKETLAQNLSWLAPGGYNRDTGNVVYCDEDGVARILPSRPGERPVGRPARQGSKSGNRLRLPDVQPPPPPSRLADEIAHRNRTRPLREDAPRTGYRPRAR